MRKIDADALIAKIASLDRIAKADSQKSLLGRVMYIVSKMPTSMEKPVEPTASGQDDWACGNCGETVGWLEFKAYGLNWTKYKYCPNCGKKVNWNG